jgi:protein arginine kinase activator
MSMRCQRCPKAATLHITEIDGGDYEEYHFCEECAQKYLCAPPAKGAEAKASAAAALLAEPEELNELNQRTCPECGMKFKEFRVQGRLGCAHDYAAFREELMPLLESIHGEVQHRGKSPRRRPKDKQRRAELASLRKDLKKAVDQEDYEAAARLRDRIKNLEG